jgi:hypothetical protein
MAMRSIRILVVGLFTFRFLARRQKVVAFCFWNPLMRSYDHIIRLRALAWRVRGCIQWPCVGVVSAAVDVMVSSRLELLPYSGHFSFSSSESPNHAVLTSLYSFTVGVSSPSTPMSFEEQKLWLLATAAAGRTRPRRKSTKT